MLKASKEKLSIFLEENKENIIEGVDLGKPKLADITDYLDTLRTLKTNLASSSLPASSEDGKRDEQNSQFKKYKYIESMEACENSLLEKVKDLTSNLTALKKASKSVQEEVDKKKNEEGEKKEALKHAKNKLKTLLSKFDAGILQKDSVLNQSLETLEELLGKKKNAKSALFKVEMEISNTNMVNTYLGVENEIERLGKIPTQEKQEFINRRKQWVVDKIDGRLENIYEATQRVKEQIRKASKAPKDMVKTLQFALCTKDIGKNTY